MGVRNPAPPSTLTGSDTQIQVRVPTGARSGNLQVVTARGSATARLTITSPWVPKYLPAKRPHQHPGHHIWRKFRLFAGQWIGANRQDRRLLFFSSWTNTTIKFRIPPNAQSGNLNVSTSEGTSNTISLEVTSPYLSRVSPTRVKPGDRLTLTGSNFRNTRGSGYVLFSRNVRPSSAGYVTWNDRRIVVEVPDRAQSGDVKVVTRYGSSGAGRIEVEKVVEPRITSAYPSRVRYNQILTLRGNEFRRD